MSSDPFLFFINTPSFLPSVASLFHTYTPSYLTSRFPLSFFPYIDPKAAAAGIGPLTASSNISDLSSNDKCVTTAHRPLLVSTTCHGMGLDFLFLFPCSMGKVLQNRVRYVENRVQELESQLSDERHVFGYRLQDLVSRYGELLGHKDRLEKQLEEKMRAAQVFSNQASTLEYRVQELKHKNIELFGEKGKLKKQLENTRKAGLLFMNAANEYQEIVHKQVKAMVEESKDTKKAGLLFMNEADEYQEVAEKRS
ncbi:hypothetical protein EJB05_01344, partial [Eragrostis curvula]